MLVGVVWACILIFVWLWGKIRVEEWCCEVVGSCEVQLSCEVRCLTLTLSLGVILCQYRHKWYMRKLDSLAYISAAESIGVSSTTFLRNPPESYRIRWNFKAVRAIRRSRSSKVTEFGTNRKLICDFLWVINTNLAHILLRFRDIAFDRSKIAIFG